MALVAEDAEDAMGKFFSSLGPFLVQFQGAEHKLARSIAILIGTTREIGLAITSERSPKDLIDWARRIAPLSKLTSVEQGELKIMVDQFAVLNELRNALVHRTILPQKALRNTSVDEPLIYRFWAGTMLSITRTKPPKVLRFTLDALMLATLDLRLISARLIPLARQDDLTAESGSLAVVKWGYSKNLP